MGLIWRRRKRLGRSTYLNMSTTGASVSKRIGPVRLSTRGRGSVRLGKGITWRFKL